MHVLPNLRIHIADTAAYIEKHAELHVRTSGRSIEEKLLNIFVNPAIGFGPHTFVTKDTEIWTGRFRYFTSRKKPIAFTLLGFPFKTPVALKTNRTTPDMGEVLMLHRLFLITEVVKSVYPPGCTITVFTEGVFAKFANVSLGEAAVYHRALVKLTRQFGYNRSLQLVPLKRLERFVSNYESKVQAQILVFRSLLKQHDPVFTKKFNAAFPSIIRILNSRQYSNAVLEKVYVALDGRQRVYGKVGKIILRMRAQAMKTTLAYLAYLKVRDTNNTIMRAVPHGLQLSVSPKPGRLGIVPIHSQIIRLPSHGVPVFHRKKGLFTIEYLYDIQRMHMKVRPVFIFEDTENKPFFYIAE